MKVMHVHRYKYIYIFLEERNLIPLLSPSISLVSPKKISSSNRFLSSVDSSAMAIADGTEYPPPPADGPQLEQRTPSRVPVRCISDDDGGDGDHDGCKEDTREDLPKKSEGMSREEMAPLKPAAYMRKPRERRRKNVSSPSPPLWKEKKRTGVMATAEQAKKIEEVNRKWMEDTGKLGWRYTEPDDNGRRRMYFVDPNSNYEYAFFFF